METWVPMKPMALVTRMAGLELVRPVMRTMRVGARRRREKEEEAKTRERKNEKNGEQPKTRERKN